MTEKIVKKQHYWNYDRDVWKIWDIYYTQENVLARSQIESFNYFMKHTLPSIITHYSPIEVKNITDKTSDRKYLVHFQRIYIGKPVCQEIDNDPKYLYPQDARNRNLSYSAPIFVDIEHEIIDESGRNKKETERQIPLCHMPIMIKSDYCNLKGLPNSVLRELGECEYDQGGYFIVGGGEKVVIPQERIAENIPHIRRKTEKKPSGVVYEYSIDIRSSLNQSYYPVKMISLKVKDTTQGSAEVPFMTKTKKIYMTMQFISGDIPIFVLFKALGVLTDYDILKYILPDIDTLLDPIKYHQANKVHLQMLDILEGSAQNIYIDQYDEEEKKTFKAIINTKQQALRYLGFKLENKDKHLKNVSDKGDEKATQLMKIVTNVIEHELLPHLGKSNIKKLHYLGYMIRILLSAVIGVIPIDDRDSVANKRIDNTGALLTQIFRSSFQRLERKIRNAISVDFLATQDANMSKKNLRGIIQGSDIESKIKYALSTGNWQPVKTSNPSSGKMGVSQALQRHSYMGYLSHLRRVQSPLESTSSKLVSPRKFHGTQLGYFCMDETPEGQNVGTVKNLTYFANITNGTDPLSIQIILNTLKHNPFEKEFVIFDFDQYGSKKVGRRNRFTISYENYIAKKQLINNFLSKNDSFSLRYFEEKVYIGQKSQNGENEILEDVDDEQYKNFENLDMEITENIDYCKGQDFNNNTLIVINGNIYGLIEDKYTMKLYNYLKLLKLSGLIDIYTSISIDFDRKELQIHTEQGRLVRPCLIVNPLYNTITDKEILYDKDADAQREQYKTMISQGRKPNYKLIETGEGLIRIKYRHILAVEQIANNLSVYNYSWNDLLTNCIKGVRSELNSMYVDRVDDDVKDSKISRTMMKIGVIEYLDIYEERNAVISFDYKTLINNRDCYIDNRFGDINTEFLHYTHCDIHPIVMKGIVAGVIPFSNKNPSPRNTYESAQSKQGICKPTTNIRQRMDTMSNELIYPQKPIVSTRGNKYIRANEIPYGSQTIVAIACYTGYNQEDSVMINKSAVDRGLFQSIFYRTYTDIEKGKTATSSNEKFTLPNEDETVGVRGRNYSAINTNGYPKLGSLVNEGDVVIGKTIEMKHDVDGKKFKDMSTIVRAGEEGQIDRILPMSDEEYDRNVFTDSEGNKIMKVRVAKLRNMIIGDKVASRIAQKGTCGMLYNQEEMPFTKNGLVPDLIMNPHAIPSRMTMGQLFESVIAKAGALSGRFYDATAFSEVDMDEIKSILRNNGFDEYGDEYLYNGLTGRKIKTKIFIGPVYYMRLKHMVEDKIHARNTGPVQLMTHQPSEGRSRGGGLRLGEMERDCMIGYGISRFLKERFMECSDKYRMYTSDEGGMNIVVNKEKGIYRYGEEDIDQKDVQELNIPYSMKLFANEGNSMGIKIIPRTEK
jgi:DNA-directed RNA polymerase beta subunit